MHHRLRIATVALALLVGRVSPSCAQPRAQQIAFARVEGDAYLVTRGGDVKRLAGRSVLLAKDTANFEVVRQIECDLFLQRIKKVDERSDYGTVAKLAVKIAIAKEMPARMDSVFLANSQRRVPAGMNAHFVFDSLSPGDYVVWTTGDLMDEHIFLRRHVAVRRGDRITADLDPSSVFPLADCGGGFLAEQYTKLLPR